MDNFYQQKESILQQSLSLFSSLSPYKIAIGIELEFYLTNHDHCPIHSTTIIRDFIAQLALQTNLFDVEAEQGIGQIEIKTKEVRYDIAQLCHDIEEIKLRVDQLARQKNIKANFQSRPFVQDCPSSLQFNISLHHANGKHVMVKKDTLFYKIIATLLDNTNAMLAILAPSKEDYARFDKEYNRTIFALGKYGAPTNLSFGHDNRTCAIRYKATKYGYKESIHGYKIEYRVASSGANPYLSLAAMIFYLARIFNDNGCNHYIETHGNAFDVQYDLEEIVTDFDQSLHHFYASGFVKSLSI